MFLEPGNQNVNNSVMNERKYNSIKMCTLEATWDKASNSVNRGGIPVRQRGMRQEMNHCSMKRSLLFISGMYPMDPKKSQPTVNT